LRAQHQRLRLTARPIRMKGTFTPKVRMKVPSRWAWRGCDPSAPVGTPGIACAVSIRGTLQRRDHLRPVLARTGLEPSPRRQPRWNGTAVEQAPKLPAGRAGRRSYERRAAAVKRPSLPAAVSVLV